VKVLYREGLATHSVPAEDVVGEEGLTTPPESGTYVREEMGVAVTGADASPVCRAGVGQGSGLAIQHLN
jgi:hypothetical protein